MLDEALRYAQRGWPVFPLLGKVPVTRHGFHDATTDAGEIVAMFAGTDLNVGISTGAAGLLVVDLDSDDAVDWWQRQGPVPTLIATTGRGQHWYYAGTGPSSAGRIAPGVDTRGAGGYVVAPPSIHPTTGGRYEWAHEAEVADLPEGLRALLSPRKPRRAKAYRFDLEVPARTHLADLARSVEQAPPGQRNDALNRAAWKARGLGWNERAACVLASAGVRAGLSWDEVTRTVASGLGEDLGTVLAWMEDSE